MTIRRFSSRPVREKKRCLSWFFPENSWSAGYRRSI